MKNKMRKMLCKRCGEKYHTEEPTSEWTKGGRQSKTKQNRKERKKERN